MIVRSSVTDRLHDERHKFSDIRCIFVKMKMSILDFHNQNSRSSDYLVKMFITLAFHRFKLFQKLLCGNQA